MAGSFITPQEDMEISDELVQEEKSYLVPFIVITTLFFMWGLLTSLNDILIPHLKELFTLNYTRIMFVQLCFFFAYFVVSLPAGLLVDKAGHRIGIMTGLTITALGCLGFYPAAEMISYPLFLTSFFILASGITILQVAANPYLAVLGSPQGAAGRLNLGQAFNSLGTTLGPYIGSILILSASDTLVNQGEKAGLVQKPYLLLALILLIITLVFSMLKLPIIKNTSTDINAQKEKEVFKLTNYPHLMLGALGIFLYVGAEVSIGSFLVNFLSIDTIGGLKEVEAGKLVSFYWGGAMVGRFIGAIVLKYVKAGKVLAFNAFIAVCLVLLTMTGKGTFAMTTILMVGLFNSIMFPNIFTLSIKGLGDFTGKASGILCMAIVGGAVLPLLQGVIADSVGIQKAFIIPTLCYCYIFYFGLKGHKIKA